MQWQFWKEVTCSQENACSWYVHQAEGLVQAV